MILSRINTGVTIHSQEAPPGGATDIAGTTMRLNRSVLRATTLLSALEEYRDGATPATLAADTGLPRPTVFRLLLTLEHAGLLTRVDGRFATNLAAAGMSDHTVSRSRTGVSQLQPILDRLAAETRETITYATPTSTQFEVTAEAPGPRILSSTACYVGQDFPLHASAIGKLFLASLPDDEVARRLPSQLEALTALTLTTRDALLRELNRVRASCYAITDNELEEGLYALAVPVSVEDDLLGALAISGLDQRLRSAGTPYLLEKLRAAAEEIASSVFAS